MTGSSDTRNRLGKDARTTREQLAESAQVHQTVRQYLKEVRRAEPVQRPFSVSEHPPARTRPATRTGVSQHGRVCSRPATRKKVEPESSGNFAIFPASGFQQGFITCLLWAFSPSLGVNVLRGPVLRQHTPIVTELLHADGGPNGNDGRPRRNYLVIDLRNVNHASPNRLDLRIHPYAQHVGSTN